MGVKEYKTGSLNIVAWLQSKGIEVLSSEKSDSSVIFRFEWTKELNDYLNDYFSNKELRGFLEKLRDLKMNMRNY